MELEPPVGGYRQVAATRNDAPEAQRGSKARRDVLGRDGSGLQPGAGGIAGHAGTRQRFAPASPVAFPEIEPPPPLVMNMTEDTRSGNERSTAVYRTEDKGSRRQREVNEERQGAEETSAGHMTLP